MKGALHLCWFITGKTQVYLLFPLSVSIPTLSLEGSAAFSSTNTSSQTVLKCLQSKQRVTAALLRKDKACSAVDKEAAHAGVCRGGHGLIPMLTRLLSLLKAISEGIVGIS